MANRTSNNTSKGRKQPQKSSGCLSPESNGSQDMNESNDAIRFLGENERNCGKYEEKRQARKEARRRKKRQRVAIVVSLCLLFVGASGIFAFRLTKETAKPEEEIIPVAAEVPSANGEAASPNETPTEKEPKNTTAASTEVDSSYTMVINRSNPIAPDYIAGTGELMEIEGKQMETKAGEALREMVAALRATGMDIIIQSGYRTDADQEYLYNRQINRQGGNERKAATISAVPLTSEHQAGLAVDLSTDGTLEESFADTEQGKWLKAHCAEYGYILRYPAGKETMTGIISEPWHFRYVGDPAQAQDIMASGKCMEEYYHKYLAAEDIDPYLPYLQ